MYDVDLVNIYFCIKDVVFYIMLTVQYKISISFYLEVNLDIKCVNEELEMYVCTPKIDHV